MASTIPDPLPRSQGAAVDPPASDRPGRIEAHGIDHIPDSERHGHPRELFSVWAAANVNYLSLVIGGALVLMGLTLWQALAVTVVGNLFWLLTGLLATSGPAAGAPSEVITRAVYGVIGNRVNNAVGGWLVSVCYFALNLAAAATAAFALVERAGMTATTPVKVAVIVIIAALTLVISVYGHGLIIKLYLPITLVLAGAFTVVAFAVLRHADFSYAPAARVSGVDLWALLLAGTTMIASGPLSYTTSADFSRYLPRTASKKAVIGWTALGAFVPSIVVGSLGAFAATAVDMTDPQTALQEILPGWFVPVFLLALVLGTIAINALTAYSAGLALQAVGLRVRRSVSVLLDGAVAIALTLYGLLVSNFLDTVSNALQVITVLIGPLMAIYATDVLLRRCRYDGVALSDETPGGPFWYTAGVNLAGATALVVGVTSAALCVNTVYTGPVAAALGGIDLSLPVGMGVSAVLYALLMRDERTVLAARAAV
ncbi:MULTISPECIES: cytosine permease [unclassified Streptomyces]|uniref:purine-cytosine permease family protein n=1 Tax=unclassified Streptomyces TaxID=2593676 RepID=UPI0006F621D6|nr:MULTISPECIES: cytosine permease [unclassified Streptomyces]KQX47889.1 nitrate reductase [Streptomyces sp. Root1304]KRA82280.1 nitrate reductase [Streptomyces sp. Root66D1]